MHVPTGSHLQPRIITLSCTGESYTPVRRAKRYRSSGDVVRAGAKVILVEHEIEASGAPRRIAGFITKSGGVYARACKQGQQTEVSGRVRRVKERLAVRTSRTRDMSPLSHPTTACEPRIRRVLEHAPRSGFGRARSQAQWQRSVGSETPGVRRPRLYEGEGRSIRVHASSLEGWYCPQDLDIQSTT